MSKMKQLDEIAQGIADVTKELMYDSIDWQLSDFEQDGDDYNRNPFSYVMDNLLLKKCIYKCNTTAIG